MVKVKDGWNEDQRLGNEDNLRAEGMERMRWCVCEVGGLKLKFRQYPAIHTNYSCSNGTISN